MAQQVLDRHRPLRIGQQQRVRAIGADLLMRDLHLSHLGKELGHRIADLEPPLLDHLQDRDADDRLGHRIDAEDRIAFHRIRRRRRVALAERRHPRDLAPPRHQHDRARHEPVVDMLLRHRLDALQLSR